MNSGFLSICNKINYKSPDDIQATLNLSNYIYASVENRYFCCLEGVNQFSVKASYAFSHDKTKRILPAQIEYLKIDEQALSIFSLVHIKANITIKGSLYIITGSLFDQSGLRIGFFVIKTAAIEFLPINELLEVNSEHHCSTIITEELPSSDFSEGHFLGTFEFLSTSYLAHEHFPSLPVFPASQSIAVISRFFKLRSSLDVRSWHKFSFVSPVFSGKVHSVHMHRLPDKNKYKVQIRNHNMVCASGVLSAQCDVDTLLV